MSYRHDTQVGGTHYDEGENPQHWDLVSMYYWDYFQAQIIKYVMRWKDKHPTHEKRVQDLKKARSFLDKYIAEAGKWDPSGIDAGISPSEELPFSMAGGETLALSPGPIVGWSFDEDIRKFNNMYFLPSSDTPGYPTVGGKMTESAAHRLMSFKKDILGEIEEVEEIIAKFQAGAPPEEVLADLADWLGDIQVWAASEMRKFGLPISETLKIIMESQWSKLGADGMPIVKDGRVVKGPNYQPPEGKLKDMIRRLRNGGDLIARFEPSGHVDGDWQCEGYFGDLTSLYRHIPSRVTYRAASLLDAKALHAAAQVPAPGV